MLGAVKSQMGMDNMVVELGGGIFKEELNVFSWIEVHFPDSYPFGVFVDIYVVIELILIRHTNVQVVTM